MMMSLLFSPVPGDLLRPTTTVNLRRRPGYLRKSTQDVVAQVSTDDRLLVLEDEPVQADGLSWWHVERVFTSGQPALQGWIARTVPGADSPLFEPAPQLHANSLSRPEPTRAILSVGNAATTQALVNLRKTPGIQNKPADDVIVAAPAQAQVVIEDGPRQIDNMTWWQVEAIVTGQHVTGWMAESTADGIRLLAPIETPSPTTLQPGDKATTQTTVRLRRSAGHTGKSNDDVIVEVPPQTIVQLIAEPQTVDGLTWWQVTVGVAGSEYNGWMAQSGPDGMALITPVATDDEDVSPPPSPSEFQIGDRVVTTTSVRLRRNPGHVNQPEGDVLGGFWPDSTLWVRGGPQDGDGLAWWLVSGIVTSGEAVTGWVARQLDNGTILVSTPPQLPGTNIPAPNQGRFLGAPFQGRRPISQLFGENPSIYGRYTYNRVALRGHNAVDFAMPVGVPLLAVDNGVVAQVGFDVGGYGHFVVTRHGWGEALYAHMNNVDISVGEAVDRGQTLGASGNTGASTGPHLHFAIRLPNADRADGWGGFRDPLPYLDPSSFILPSYLLRRNEQRAIGPVGSFNIVWALPPSGMSEESEEHPRP